MKTNPGSELYGEPWRIFSSSSSCSSCQGVDQSCSGGSMTAPSSVSWVYMSAVMKSHDFMGEKEIYECVHCEICSRAFVSYSTCEFGRVGWICEEKPKTMTVTWKEFGSNNPLFFLSGCCIRQNWNRLQNVQSMSTTLCPSEWLSCLIWQDINHLCQ